MDYLNKIKGWAKGIADVGVSLIALGIVLEILFNGQGIPFWPNVVRRESSGPQAVNSVLNFQTFDHYLNNLSLFEVWQKTSLLS